MIANAIRHDVPHGQHLDAGLTHYAPELSMRCLGSLQVYWPLIQRGSERKQCRLLSVTGAWRLSTCTMCNLHTAKFVKVFVLPSSFKQHDL